MVRNILEIFTGLGLTLTAAGVLSRPLSSLLAPRSGSGSESPRVLSAHQISRRPGVTHAANTTNTSTQHNFLSDYFSAKDIKSGYLVTYLR